MEGHNFSKPFLYMSIEELQFELGYWQGKIEEAKSWGAAVAAAGEFRDEIIREIAKLRTLKAPPPWHSEVE